MSSENCNVKSISHFHENVVIKLITKKYFNFFNNYNVKNIIIHLYKNVIMKLIKN